METQNTTEEDQKETKLILDLSWDDEPLTCIQTFRISEEDLDILNAACAHYDVTRSKLFRALLRLLIQEYSVD